MTSASEPLLSVDHLQVAVHRPGSAPVSLVRDATFQVRAGEIVCLVGESGSGKSVTAKALAGLMQRDPRISATGRIRFNGDDLDQLSEPQLRRLRGREMAMVFQEPMSSMDPVFNVRSQLREAISRTQTLSRGKMTDRMRELLTSVGITDADRVARSYPHQLSGGMCQRVMIAMALASQPKLLIADEPTTALDVTIQAQILRLIDKIRTDTNMAVLLVTHDMGIAADLADRVLVMYAGRIVEDSNPLDMFARPAHPYSAGLLACVPPMSGPRPKLLPAIPGNVPDPAAIPTGCAFNPRCPRAFDRCRTEDPALSSTTDAETDRTRWIACWNPEPGSVAQPTVMVASR